MSSGTPCSCTAIRLPGRSRASSQVSSSSVASLTGEKVSLRPPARTAPVAFGPRVSILLGDLAAVGTLARVCERDDPLPPDPLDLFTSTP
ncbi:hypothetical protein ACFRCI_15810 [Streptomyces sp. NPDC056638]|uniref:hypothetical protein n=1 Tax=Streptomyces sp. NPDC056638 TaxID=3345887 RepID=UPI00368DA727